VTVSAHHPRLGLCCSFSRVPIKFRVTTARYLSTLDLETRRRFLGELCLHNATALQASLTWCAGHGVGAFRILSQFFPITTHPDMGYRWTDLPTAALIEQRLAEARAQARRADIRLSFHPDQFVVPGSATAQFVRASLKELEYLAEVGQLVGAEQLTIHGGGAQGGKPAALARLLRGVDRLSPRARRLMVLENDDRVYTVRDLIPVCRSGGLPLIYDVHHHRCNPDGLSVEEATALAAETWSRREPWFHLSSPALGWRSQDPRPHHQRISLRDFPAAWRGMRATIDVEAKAKEQAVLSLLRALRGARAPAPGAGRRLTPARPDRLSQDRPGVSSRR
jgi:UV DNA damage endonuclease